MRHLIAALFALIFPAFASAAAFIPGVGSVSCPGNETTSSSSANIAIPNGPRAVYLLATTASYINFGQTNTTAAVVGGPGNLALAANVPYYLGLPGTNSMFGTGQWYLAYIASSGGTLNVCFGNLTS